MTGRSLKGVQDGPSSRMKLAIILLLLIILLPATFTSLPVSKIVLVIRNADPSNAVSVNGYVSGVNDGYIYLNILPGDDITQTYRVTAGTYQINIHYTYPDEGYYGNTLWHTSTLWPFEVDEVHFNLVD